MKELWLPNKYGNYKSVLIPKYMDEVLWDRRHGKCVPRIHEIGEYFYRIDGWNKNRKAYGIYADIDKFKKFLDKYSKFDDGSRLITITHIGYHEKRNNYYATFKMVDPYALAFEKAGLIYGY